MNLVLFVNGAVKPYVDWLENRKRYGTSQEKYRRRGSAVLHTGPHAMQSNPYSGLCYRRVILTLKFIPHELKKNFRVINGGIGTLNLDCRVKLTLFLEISQNISLS